jgi:hypothetical protein
MLESRWIYIGLKDMKAQEAGRLITSAVKIESVCFSWTRATTYGTKGAKTQNIITVRSRSVTVTYFTTLEKNLVYKLFLVILFLIVHRLF